MSRIMKMTFVLVGAVVSACSTTSPKTSAGDGAGVSGDGGATAGAAGTSIGGTGGSSKTSVGGGSAGSASGGVGGTTGSATGGVGGTTGVGEAGHSGLTGAAGAGNAGRDGGTDDAPTGIALSPYKGVSFTGTTCADLDKLGAAWFYDWGTSSSCKTNAQYVPTVWGGWTAATNPTPPAKLATAGAKIIIGFNEPDHPDQSNLTVAAA